MRGEAGETGEAKIPRKGNRMQIQMKPKTKPKTKSKPSKLSSPPKPALCRDCGTPLSSRHRKRCPACAIAYNLLRDRLRKQEAARELRGEKRRTVRVTRTCERCKAEFTASERRKRTLCCECSMTSYRGTSLDPLFCPEKPKTATQSSPGRPEDCQMIDGELQCPTCTRMDCRIAVYRRRVAAGVAVFNRRDGIREDGCDTGDD